MIVLLFADLEVNRQQEYRNVENQYWDSCWLLRNATLRRLIASDIGEIYLSTFRQSYQQNLPLILTQVLPVGFEYGTGPYDVGDWNRLMRDTNAPATARPRLERNNSHLFRLCLRREGQLSKRSARAALQDFSVSHRFA